MTLKTTVLKDVAMVMLNITVWSGAKKLEPSDFINVDVDDLPSSRVASFGIKHLIDKQRLAPFKSVRGHADRLCARWGTRFLGGFAIPQDCVDLVGQELKLLCDRFEEEIDRFIADYDQATEDWITSNPEFSDVLRRSILPPAVVRSRFKAAYSIFEIDAHPRDTTQSLSSATPDLLDSVLLGVVGSLNSLIDRAPALKTYRQEVRITITEAALKIRRFAFLDSSGGMTALADDLQRSVTGTGTIKGLEFDTLRQIIDRFGTVDGIKEAIAQRAQTPVPGNLLQPGIVAAPVLPPSGEMGRQLNLLAGIVTDPSGKACSQRNDGKHPIDLFDLDLGFGDETPAAPPDQPTVPVESQPVFSAVFDW